VSERLAETYRYLPTCLLETLYYWLVQASCLLIKGSQQKSGEQAGGGEGVVRME
jgi:hypothetical protein